ncbi:hypothetical protein PSEUBRA_005483 [Kalmanozyma brasiliensis GHG001]|uniref:uncharacterized protein n=1 Tax=Kalmanozyma brasiliensis (strain GHG001) TaxID=1365824 RepID=UPI00286813DA|nr:uncharacterized protein PSEUBRA_005483 [Kalmanozyma brasiliensis GHG001]EST05217.2 hypothetical protein PSEUBRA_005483 [Kalmanozyma brasiliensis GHG001]
MLVYMSQYVEERSAAPSPAPVKPSASPAAASKSKKGKINFVSKASLAIFDPRHAMGIDTGDDWYASRSPETRSSFDQPSQHALHRSENTIRNQQWTASPTPELEAFSASADNHPYGSFSTTEMTRQQSASSSVFEDDRDVPEATSRRRFLSRKSVATGRATTPTEDLLISPLSAKTKANRNAGAGASAASTSNASSFTRFFARKKKDRAPHLGGMASRSTPDFFDDISQSAPPTTLTFEQSGYQFSSSPQRKASDASSSVHSSPSSLPASPERRPARVAHDASSRVRASPLSSKQSMPALRQIREAHSAAGAPQSRSITFASPERKPRTKSSAATTRTDPFDAAPALPPLPSFSTSSPMIPLEFAWDAKRSNAAGRESQAPSSGFSIRPTSRVVSSTSRGVPSPGVSPVRPTEVRKVPSPARSVPALRFAEDVRSAPIKSTVTRPAASPRRHADPKAAAAALEKRKSMTQRVVDGMLDQNHGREEPEMRARRTDMEVRSARRRSRSADGRTLPALKMQDFTNSPRSNSHSDSVFPAFVRHAPAAPGGANSPQSRFFADTETARSATPTFRQTSPRAASPNRSPVAIVAQNQSPSRRSPQRQASGETHQARRVNFVGQRAKAVAVGSPMLLSKSPRLGGRSGTPLPIVNIMPPTPDLASSEEHQPREEAMIQQPTKTVVTEQAPAPAPTPVVAAVETEDVSNVTISSPVKPDAESTECDVPSRQGAVTPTPKTVGAQAVTATVEAPARSIETAPASAMSPASVYSPASIYSPEANEGPFSALGLFRTEDAVSKEDMQITADSVATELSYVGMTRTESVSSELSGTSSARSSSSGAFAYSRSMSISSLVSGGTYSSASSEISDSPDRKMGYLPSIDSPASSLSQMSSSASLASTTGTSIFETEAELRGMSPIKSGAGMDASEALALRKLKTPFQVKNLTVDTEAAQSAADSSDCETPTLESCRQMGANNAHRTQAQQAKASTNRQLGLSMDLSDLAQELGLGRLSQIGLAHLKGVEAFAEKPARQPTAALGTASTGTVQKVTPAKPPKSSARAAAASRPMPAPAADASASGLARFGVNTNDIAASAAMSPLPVSIAGRSPQTPPRTRSTPIESNAGRKVSASGVPKIDGGFGLGLNFIESPSPQSRPRKAAITPGSYGQHVVEQTHVVPARYQHHQHAYEPQEDSEWFGVAM